MSRTGPNATWNWRKKRRKKKGIRQTSSTFFICDFGARQEREKGEAVFFTSAFITFGKKRKGKRRRGTESWQFSFFRVAYDLLRGETNGESKKPRFFPAVRPPM